MRERVVATLPSRDLDATEAFYARLGFATAFRDATWMILRRGPLEIEVAPHPGLDPATSPAGATVRVADARALHADWARAGLPDAGIPRLTAPADGGFGWLAFALVDPDGSLLRVLSPVR